MLPSASVGTIECRSLMESMRKIVSKVKGSFIEGEAVDVDIVAKKYFFVIVFRYRRINT